MPRPRATRVVGWLLPGCLLLAGACGDSKPSRNASRPATTLTTQPATSSTTEVPSDTTTTTDASGDTGSSARSGAGAAKDGKGPAPAGGSKPATAAGGPAPIAAGTYRYRQSGQASTGASTVPVPPEGSLRAEPSRPDGTQLWHRVIGENLSMDDTVAFRPDGMFLVSSVLNTGGGGQSASFTCTFDPPVPVPPWPPSVGRTLSGHGECQEFTVDVKGTIEGTRSVSLDGVPVEVFVVKSTIVTTGQLESTTDQVDWFAPSLRMVVHSEGRQRGTFGGAFPFTSEITSDLVSGRPS